jgi:hypothetical protein
MDSSQQSCDANKRPSSITEEEEEDKERTSGERVKPGNKDAVKYLY